MNATYIGAASSTMGTTSPGNMTSGAREKRANVNWLGVENRSLTIPSTLDAMPRCVSTNVTDSAYHGSQRATDQIATIGDWYHHATAMIEHPTSEKATADRRKDRVRFGFAATSSSDRDQASDRNFCHPERL